MFEYTIVSQNVKDFGRNKLNYVEAKALIKRCMLEEPTALIGLQEMHSPEHVTALRDACAETGWECSFGKIHAQINGTPVAWKSEHWDKLNSRSSLLHRGLARVCQKRFITEVTLRRKGSSQVVRVLNTHFIPGAFKAHRGLRRRYWNAGLKRLRRRVWAATQESRVDIIVVTGDMNRAIRRGRLIRGTVGGVKFTMHPSNRQNSIDQVYVGSRAPHARGYDVSKKPTASDHERLTVKFRR